MKKIMFNDKYGLTQAVLEGRKTMTRRSIPKKLLESIELYAHGNEEELRHRLLANSSYHVGEVVAIAQCYYDVYEDNSKETMFSSYVELPCWSVGRLIEIYHICVGPGCSFTFHVCFPNLVNEIIYKIAEANSNGWLNLKKLEE